MTGAPERWSSGRWGVVALSGVAIAVASRLAPRFTAASPTVALVGELGVQSALLLGAPLAIGRWILGARPGALGLSLGAPARWGPWLLALAAVALPLGLALSRLPAVHAAYPLWPGARRAPWLLLPSTLAFGIYGLGWELFFRGFLLQGLRPRFGPLAVVLQAIPCALLHVGKPGAELAAALPAALVFGALAYAWRSVIPGWLLHAAIALTVNLACVLWA